MAWTIFRGFNHVGIFTGESQAAPAVVCTCSINKKKPWDAGQMIPTNTSTKITAVAGCSQQNNNTQFSQQNIGWVHFLCNFHMGWLCFVFFFGGGGGAGNVTWSALTWLEAPASDWRQIYPEQLVDPQNAQDLGVFFWEIITVGGVGARGGYTLAIL